MAPEDKPAEFDDIERNGAYIGSKKARTEMGRIAHEHGLGFVHNPGGGAFNGVLYGRPFRCQVSTCDDINDLATLRAAIASRAS